MTVHPPITLEEALGVVYGQWLHNPGGWPYDKNNCAYPVYRPTHWASFQCERKPGNGPAALYCKQHAKKIEGSTT